MELKLDDSKIQEILNGTVAKTVQNAFAGYEVSTAVANLISKDVATGAIARAMDKAISQLDTETLTTRLAAEIEQAATSVVVHILHEGLLSLVFKMRGLSEYSDTDKAEKARLRAELFPNKGA